LDEIVAPSSMSPDTVVCSDTGGGGCSANCNQFCGQNIKGTCTANCWINIGL